MSFPEYRQKPEDHRSCIILVCPIGPFISKEKFTQLWDQVNRIGLVSVTKDGRSLSPKFVLNYPVENSEWGDFQYHRKVLGLICIAQYNEDVMGEDLEKQYTDLKNLYDSTLVDTRLIVLGLPHKTSLVDKGDNSYSEPMNGSPTTDNSLVIEPNHYDELPDKDILEYSEEEGHQVMSEMSDVTRRRILGYMDCDEACSYMNIDVEYMCKSMFYVLESKRLTATNVHLKQPSILTAPFEKPGVISMDIESKNVRNRFVARCRKRVGDLCLLVDMPNEAVVQYQAAMELLKAAGDDLWVGCALEGVAVSSSLVLMNQAVGDVNMKRTSSYTGRSSPGLLLDPSLSLQNSFSHLDLASTKSKLNVTADDIIDQYREAISFYSKFPAAAIVEMEASLKATRLLIAHKKLSSRVPALSIANMSEKGLVGENVLNKMLSPAFKAASKKNGEHVVDNDHRVRLEQLKSHPLFNDLQVTLALDCVQSKVPYSLLGDLSSTGSSPVGFDTSFSTVSDVVAKEHANMQMMLQVYFPSLLASYQQLTDQFEIQRYKALAFNCHSSDANQLINWFYNRERENLIKGMKLTLDAVTKKTKALIPDPIKMNVDIWNNLASNIGLPPPVVPPAPTVTEHGETPLDLSGSQNKQSTTSTTGQKKSRFLSKKAVSILQRWYQQHREHPYATDEEVKELAAAGGISHNQKIKTAAEFLHHVAYVILDDFTHKERVERYDVMGDLYHQLKFDRKASFFKRVAAMHCVSPLLPSPAWSECYKLILQAFPGFNMSFDPLHYHRSKVDTGWPGIRARVFHELVYASRQLGDRATIVRHASLSLHALYDWMQEKEVVDVVQLLESCTKVEVDQGLPLTTLTGEVIPPVSFSSFPLLSYFEVLKLPPQLEPHKLKQVLPSNSVFIYSPMSFSRQVSKSESITEYEFCWVQGNAGSVEVQLHNPLPIPLKITDFSLIVEGVKFQSYPSSHSLPSKSGPHSIHIVGTPRHHGTLKITGYQMTLFGVVSRCLFSQLLHLKQNLFTVDVAPVLPSLHTSSDLPKSPYMVTGGDNQILTSAILQIYIGEQRECSIKLKNTGNVTITKIQATLESEKYRDILERILVLDMCSIQNSLPLLPDQEAVVVIKTVGTMKLSDLPDATLMSPSQSGESKQRASSALIESLLKITYTGEEGDNMNYYRESFMAIDTVLIPSINIISQHIHTVDADSCKISYKVFNESNMALDIKSKDSTVSLKPMQSDWIHSSIFKCDSAASLEQCKQAISANTHMKWCSEERQKVGLVPSDRLQWQDVDLDKLRKRPFSVNGQVTKNSCSRYMVGEPIKFSYEISNTSGLDYDDVSFHITVLQDIASGRVELQANTCFVHIGQSTHSVSKFRSGESQNIDHMITLLYGGMYIIECQCMSNGLPIHNIDPGISIQVS